MLGSNLINAIHNERGVASILKDRSKQEIQDILLNYTHKVNSKTCVPVTYTLLTYAICEHNDQAIEDILQIAEENGILEQVLGLRATDQLTSLLKHNTGLPFYYAIEKKNDQAIKSILEKSRRNGIEGLILNNTAGDIVGNIESRHTDKWIYLFSKHPNIACSILKSGPFKYRFTEKELGKLTEKIDKGKCKEVINTIRKRQLHLSCAISVAMIAAAVGITAGTVWLGIEYGVFPFIFFNVISVSQVLPAPAIPALLVTAGALIALCLGTIGGVKFLDSFHELNEMEASEPNTDMNGVSTQNQEKTEQHI